MKDSVRRARDLIDARFADLDGPEELADLFDLSLETLRRAFRREVGVPPGEYLTQRRVDEAKRLLAETDLRAFEVGHAVGWDRDDTAARTFRRVAGTTMQAYRRDVRGETGGGGE